MFRSALTRRPALRRRHPLAALTATAALTALAVTGAADAGAAARSQSPAKPAGGKLGTFTFSKELTGSVTEPNLWEDGYFTSNTCQKTENAGEFNIEFNNLKVKLNGRNVVLTGGDSSLPFFLFVSVRRYGDTESVANSTGDPTDPEFAATTTLDLRNGQAEYAWLTDTTSANVNSSGTVTTNASGTKGSLNVTMVPSGTGETSGLDTHARGDLTVKGSWSTCAKSLAAP